MVEAEENIELQLLKNKFEQEKERLKQEGDKKEIKIKQGGK